MYSNGSYFRILSTDLYHPRELLAHCILAEKVLIRGGHILEEPFFVGTDIGTFGTKCCTVDRNGTTLSAAYKETDILIPKPGWAEQWPNVWWEAYCDTMKRALKSAKVDPKHVAAVCISGLYSGSGVTLDKGLQPLRPCMIWMDRRATEETVEVKQRFGEDEIFRITGNVIDPYYGFTKLLWIKKNEPKVWESTRQLVTANAWCIFKLTGKLCIDHSSACLIGGLYDLHKHQWSEKLMDELGINRTLFPEEINSSKDVVGEVTAEASRATGLREHTPVCAGGIDAAVSALSATALNDGDLTSMIGTSMCNGFIQDNVRLSRKLINFPHVAYDTKKLYSFAGISTAGAVIRWFRDQLDTWEKNVGEQPDHYKILDNMAAKVPPGAEGLVFMPHMVVGERAPYWDEYLRGCLFGLTLYHTKAHQYRSFLEGVAYAVRYSIDVAKEAGIPLRRAIVVDGGAKSALWRQIFADVANMPFQYIKAAAGAPMGDALLAGVGTRFLKPEDIFDWVKVTSTTNPTPSNVAIYEKYYSLYMKLYHDTKESFKALKEITD
jgi:sugar (pentulose or hexulose) kinase